MWTQPKVYILELSNFNTVHQIDLQYSSVIDLLMMKFVPDGITHLLILQGDGLLVSYVVIDNNLFDERQTILGTYCTSMYPYVYQGRRKVFITGNQPAIVTSFKNELQVFTVNTIKASEFLEVFLWVLRIFFFLK